MRKIMMMLTIFFAVTLITAGEEVKKEKVKEEKVKEEEVKKEKVKKEETKEKMGPLTAPETLLKKLREIVESIESNEKEKGVLRKKILITVSTETVKSSNEIKNLVVKEGLRDDFVVVKTELESKGVEFLLIKEGKQKQPQLKEKKQEPKQKTKKKYIRLN